MMTNIDFRRPLAKAAGAFMGMFLLAVPALAGDASPPLNTGQQYLEETGRKHDLDASDHMAVFGFILNSLPDRVKVYPTENYYYFSFMCNGVNYEGNIRFDVDRDQGFLHFAYVEQPALWRRTEDDNYHHLGAKDGLKIDKLAELSYRVTYKDRSVVFDMNDLSAVKPPEGMLNTNEVYIGPSFDESGMAFYLVFNKDVKVFHFIYNEKNSFPERFDKVSFSDRITIGRRTSFAFYRDQKDRQILIGVHQVNTFVNNSLDGPFDQLPDNFIQGDSLKDAILSIQPDLKDKIDRYGSIPNGEERYAITPYMYYGDVADLKKAEDCVNDKSRAADQYYACFNMPSPDEGPDQEGKPGDDAKAPEAPGAAPVAPAAAPQAPKP